VTESLVVDANPLLSALLGGSAREVIFSGKFAFYAPQHTLFEVEKYLPRVARKLGQSEADLFRAFGLLPVIACQPRDYDSHVPQAEGLIGPRDPKDVHVLALALKLTLPIWTQDRDFEGLSGVTVRTTAEMVAIVSG
jgi:predicted nucleic acid-binding protein